MKVLIFTLGTKKDYQKIYTLEDLKRRFLTTFEINNNNIMREKCMKKCNMVFYDKWTTEYIDKLFGYSKSIKEIKNEWGWLALYQKYINILKTNGGVDFIVSTISSNNIKIRIYR